MKAFLDNYDTPIKAGKKVIVVGGGNVAMDAARTARRLGAEVHIVYRRGEEELPARKEEVHHAKEEGIIFDLLQNPTELLVDENGCVKGAKVIRMELGEPDASGRRSPVEIPGSEYEIEADTVIKMCIRDRFISFSILNIADLSTDGCFTLGCAVCASVTLAGHPILGLFAAMEMCIRDRYRLWISIWFTRRHNRD